MSDRDMVIELVTKLPADIPLDQIAREIEFFAATTVRAHNSRNSEQPLTEAELRACYDDPEEIRLLNRFGNESI